MSGAAQSPGADHRRATEVVRGWLQRELGDAAGVYDQGAADPLPAAVAAARFSLSVPVGDVAGLVWLMRKRGPVRSAAMVVLVIAVVADGELRSVGRQARRDVIVHFREAV